MYAETLQVLIQKPPFLLKSLVTEPQLHHLGTSMQILS